MKRQILFFLILISVAAISPVAAQTKYAVLEGEPDFQFPEEAKPFIETGMKAIAYAKADLNGDGTLDYIIVLEEVKEIREIYADMSERPTLIIVRDKNGKLNLAERNRRVVFCTNCAGGMGDPLDDIVIERGGFSITNRGGNRERWVGTYEFKYSRRHKTWQLVRVVEMNYDSTNRIQFGRKLTRRRNISAKSTSQILTPKILRAETNAQRRETKRARSKFTYTAQTRAGR